MKKKFLINQTPIDTNVTPVDQKKMLCRIEAKTHHVSVLRPLNATSTNFSLLVAGRVLRGHMEMRQKGGAIDLWVNGQPFAITAINQNNPLQLQRKARSVLTGDWSIRAEMPGKVVKILVTPGTEVETQQPILVLEAMKMENEIKALQSGSVKEIVVSLGQSVEKGQELVRLHT